MVFPPEKEIETPLHKHKREDITFYIIEGTFLIKYGSKSINGNQGMMLKLEKT
jgi:quercetin dioxygenase-like cupin family protein